MNKIACTAALASVMLLTGCRNSEKPAVTSVNIISLAAETTSTPASDTAPLERYVPTCAEIAAEALKNPELDIPLYMEVTDDIMMTDVIGYDLSHTEDHCVNVQLISANLFELTVIRPAEKYTDEVKKMLEERRKYLREQAAYYPAQVKAAEAAVITEVGGYCCLVCAENADKIADVLMYTIMKN